MKQRDVWAAAVLQKNTNTHFFETLSCSEKINSTFPIERMLYPSHPEMYHVDIDFSYYVNTEWCTEYIWSFFSHINKCYVVMFRVLTKNDTYFY